MWSGLDMGKVQDPDAIEWLLIVLIFLRKGTRRVQVSDIATRAASSGDHRLISVSLHESMTASTHTSALPECRVDAALVKFSTIRS